MMWVRVEHGTVHAGLPQVGVLADGSTVSVYDALPAEILAGEGWQQVEVTPPAHDPVTEMLTGPVWRVVDGVPVPSWVVEPLPAPEPEPEPEAVSAMAAFLATLTEAQRAALAAALVA